MDQSTLIFFHPALSCQMSTGSTASTEHCHLFNVLVAAFIFSRDFWSAHHRLHGPWIVKPVASSRGRGIYLVSKVLR